MNRLLFIARFEYLRYLRQRAFLIGTFLMPLILIAIFITMMAVILLTEEREEAIGYVDRANLLPTRETLATLETTESLTDATASSATSSEIPLHPYADEARARAAFVEGDISAYIVIPADYLETGKVFAFGEQSLSAYGTERIRTLLHESILADISPEHAARINAPLANLNHRSLDDNRAASDQHIPPFFLPFLFGMLFSSGTLASSGYLLQAVIEEKENRTMEIIITSVTPEQMIGGKTLGLGALGLTRAMIWFGPPGLMVAVAVARSETPLVQLPDGLLLVGVLVFILGYLLYSGLMVTIGAMVTSMKEGQQMASYISLFSNMPLMLHFIFLINPNGPLAVGLSIFPLSAPLALMMRMPMTQVPLWQIMLSLSLLVCSVALVILVAGGIFRTGMLQYGQAIKLYQMPGILASSFHTSLRRALWGQRSG